jgi:hypothetical protein
VDLFFKLVKKLMKTLLGASFIFSILLLFIFQFSLSSCTKDNTIYKTDTVTVIKKDTVIIKDTAISLELLTANSWKMQEVRGVIGNTILYYQRGGTGNTENYDNEYITFNTNKTGILFDANNATHQITWDFANTALTKLTIVVQNPAPLASQTMVYENLRYKNKALLFDQYWTYNGTNSHVQVIRTPK